MDEVALADLIAPIAGAMPAGVDVRHAGPASELYLSVKDDRAAARAAEREALAAGDPDIAPLAAGLRAWTSVATGAARLLAEHGKDVQVAAWLVEAWLRTDGLAGVADGFTLLAELVAGYWDDGLHPLGDEDGGETDGQDARLAPLFGLFGREEPSALVQPLKLLPLTDAPDEPVALWTLEAVRAQSVRHDDPDMREQLAARHAARVSRLEGAVAAASRPFVERSLEAADRAVAELDRLMAALDVRTQAGRFGSQVSTPLLAIAAELRRHYAPIVAAPTPVAIEPMTEPSDPAAVAASPSPVTAPVPDRSGMLATLLEIAGFFDRTEPQSLVGQGLREVVRRANLPLDELIGELLPDREQRAMFMLRAGIKVEPAGDGGGFTTF